MYEIPSFLKLKLYDQYGNLAEKVINGYACDRISSLRVNSLKTTADVVRKALFDGGIPSERVAWYGDALVCKSNSETALQQCDCYRNGEIYLQSLSSMLPPLVLAPQEGESILDMTAAPGGKTTQLSALSHGKALITACERDKIRFERLRYNVEKQGAPRIALMQTDASKLDNFFRFDKILLDAPCSGSGTVDLKKPIRLSEKLIAACVNMQMTLLRKALTLLKSGGEMVYSTCSVLQCENEGVLERVLPEFRAKLLPVGISGGDFVRLPSLENTLCICPDERYEGFFVAKIQKP